MRVIAERIKGGIRVTITVAGEDFKAEFSKGELLRYLAAFKSHGKIEIVI